MLKILEAALHYIRAAATYTTVTIFIISGLYLLVIDGADLETKGLKKQLTAVRIIGLIYIFGSAIAFILFKYVI